ncbi:MAG: FKBP-type peptidyl-prolyl cis-trans isomerase [Sphaerochaetaceae bacterium]|nr:FKBP-type peptidyl-prolyl cis-trans isomerase [Sphaerochaetaceae bacterium]
MQRKYSTIVTSSVLIAAVISTFLISSCKAGLTQESEQVQPVIEQPKAVSSSGIEGEQKPVEDEPLTFEQLLEQFTLEVPQTLDERFSYTYGYMLMDSALREISTLDVPYFLKGAVDAAIRESELLSREERNSTLYEFQDKLIEEAGERIRELKEKNLKDAESFLAVNGQREQVFTTDSGLQYEILEQGEGQPIEADDVVKVNYKLTYLDGREGESSVSGVPSTFTISKLVPGFREGLLLMNVGSTYRFYVHPSLGYGEQGSTRIEPNTLLIFDVELVDVVD